MSARVCPLRLLGEKIVWHPFDYHVTHAVGIIGAPLVDLIPFAVNNHATVFEIYYQDWLTAYDPDYPGYFPAYQAVLQTAARRRQLRKVTNWISPSVTAKYPPLTLGRETRKRHCAPTEDFCATSSVRLKV